MDATETHVVKPMGLIGLITGIWRSVAKYLNTLCKDVSL